MSDTVRPSDSVPLSVRADRYSHLLSPDKLAQAHVAVIGCGAVGRQAAIQLASMGIGRLTLVDFDVVSAENLGPQGWMPNQIGSSKVLALGEDLLRLNPEARVVRVSAKFDPLEIKEIPLVLSCVDSMEVRKEIFEAATADLLTLKLFAEARMTAENCIANFVYDTASAARWLKGWYPTSEGWQEGCTTKSTIYCASMAASMLVAGVSKALRGHLLPWSASYNLPAFDGTVEWPHEEAPAEEVEAAVPEHLREGVAHVDNLIGAGKQLAAALGAEKVKEVSNEG